MTELERDEARKLAMREYARKWRAANPGKTAEYNRRFWERKGLEMLGNNAKG